MPETSSADPAALARELDKIAQREARLRLKVAEQFLVLDTQLKAHRKRIDELSDELGRRNTYIHELHQEAQSAVRREQELHEQIAGFMQHLAASEASLAAARDQINRMKHSWGWTLATPLRRLQRWFTSKPPAATTMPSSTSGKFVYYLTTSPFRLYRPGPFTLQGWAHAEDGRRITGIRVRLDEREYLGQHGLPEPAATHPESGATLDHPGFAARFEMTPGRHQFCLEAQLDNREWAQILQTPLWCRSS